jgi:hypothetical protein
MTGSSEHLYFHHPGMALKNSVGSIAECVDVRADRGYVVAAPSQHANGKRYTWKNTGKPLADVPAWLLAKIMTKKEKREEMHIEERNPLTEAPTVHEGTRNDTLYKLGCALLGKHAMERSSIASALIEYNESKCDPPLGEAEVLGIVDSVCRYPAEASSSKSLKRQEQSPLYWYQFNTREWFSNQNVMMMDDRQTGWYIRLKALAWDGGGFLSADIDKLWRLAKAKSKKAFERDCGLVLAEYEPIEVDGEPMLKHPQMAKRFADTLEDWMKKKEAGEASKASRSAARLTQPELTSSSQLPVMQ